MAKEKSDDPLFGKVPDNAQAQGTSGGTKDGQDDQSKDDLPEALKDKTPKEIYEMMNSEHNRVMTDTVQQMAQRAAPAPVKPEVIPKAPPTAVQPQTVQPEEPPDQHLDPDGFMDYQFGKRLGPILQQQVTIARGQNRNFFKQSVGEEEWGKYGVEIEQFMDGLHPQVQSHPDAYQRARDIVMSSHKDEIVEEETNKRTVATVTKTLAGLGMTPEQITQALKATAAGTPLQTVVQKTQDAQEQAARQSLFQGNTGIRQPIVDALKNTVQAVYPKPGEGGGRKKERHPDAKAVMDAFGMTDEEYTEYEDQNTDLVSQINRGEIG